MLGLSEKVGSSRLPGGRGQQSRDAAVARARCAGRDNVGFFGGEAPVTALPVESGTSTARSASRFCYVSDVDAVLAELHRALRPGGRAVVWALDWATVSIHSLATALIRPASCETWTTPRRLSSLPRSPARSPSLGRFERTGVSEAQAFTVNGDDAESFGAALVPFDRDVRRGPAGVEERKPKRGPRSSAS